MKFRGYLGAAAGCAALFALWLLLVGQISGPECLLGGGCTLIALVATAAFRRTAVIRLALDFRMVAQAYRIPVYLATGTAELFEALGRQLLTASGAASYLAAVPYASPEATPRAATRRALAVAYTTCTPNFVILGIIPRQRLLVFHQVKRSGLIGLARRLGAGARATGVDR
jgi:hypothetical protein